MNQKIVFSYNWNHKLYSDYFTSFRILNRKKYSPGNVFDAVLMHKNSVLFSKPVQVILYVTCKLADAPEMMCYLDAGYSKSEFIKLVRTMYKNADIDFINQEFCFVLFGPIKTKK